MIRGAKLTVGVHPIVILAGEAALEIWSRVSAEATGDPTSCCWVIGSIEERRWAGHGSSSFCGLLRRSIVRLWVDRQAMLTRCCLRGSIAVQDEAVVGCGRVWNVCLRLVACGHAFLATTWEAIKHKGNPLQRKGLRELIGRNGFIGRCRKRSDGLASWRLAWPGMIWHGEAQWHWKWLDRR